MLSLLRKIYSDAYIRNAAVFLTGVVLVGFLNYALSPILSRLLSVVQFGEFQAALALFTELAMILSAFSLATVHASANYERPGECAAVTAFLRDLSLVVVVLVFLAIFAGSSLFASALQFTSITPFFALAAMLVSGALLSLRTGYLQGRSRFGTVTAVNLIVATGRLLLATAFVVLGLKVTGALLGIVVGQLAGVLLAWAKTKNELNNKAEFGRLPKERVKSELFYVIFAFISIGFITVLYTADVLVVKLYLPPDVAGLYSAVSAVAKIIMFIAGPLSTVMLPTIKRRNTSAANWLALRKALICVISVGGAGTLMMVLFPKLIVRFLMGTRFLTLAGLLPPLATAFFLAALAYVFVCYAVALRRYWLVVIIMVDMLFLVFLSVMYHSNVNEVVVDFFLASCVAVLSTTVFVARDLLRRGHVLVPER